MYLVLFFNCVIIIKATIWTVQLTRWNLVLLIDFKSFIQMIYILFGLSNIIQII